MAERIILPKQGLQMTEGTITEWCALEGDPVTEGQPLFTMETDKLVITIDAPVSGTLLKILREVGETVPITETIAIVGAPGEDIDAFLVPAREGNVTTATAPPLAQGVGEAAANRPVGRGPGERVLITPRAKARAAELHIDYTAIAGSAPDGTIVERDILGVRASAPRATPLARKAAEAGGVPLNAVSGTGARGKITREDVLNASVRAPEGEGTGISPTPEGARTLIPMRGMRKVIAERMKHSQNINAQATHRIAVRMDRAKALREALGKSVGYNDLIAYATARALREFPKMNAELTEEGIWQKDFVHLGVAVALEDGLIVPVVRDADRLSLAALSARIKALAQKARDGQLRPDEYAGGTFTVSNLGMFGLEEFVAIINPPEAGILAVGKIEETPVAVEGQVEILPIMKLTLSYDHRVVDGAPAAQFLARIKEYLEEPYRLL